ncbi:pyridoxal-phosphate dependent enzyme [Niabella pedocola]|uniref:Pyridoxal-phosphate dependent enzyme n=1 Tax=Niabella pedocola TaxID=1752077 RepID=A0ABS8PNV0_9BACT|nr:pyridoxal-phosphate dependent enzyme [Niabella pedocola]MCD2422545.1 pyridoxal-phosphate dependent enzyme [Niabella pedocola]
MKGIWTYSALLPAIDEKVQLTLGEGNTPLIRSRRIGRLLGMEQLYFKLEQLNPTGSYKDRFAAMAVSGLLAQDASFFLATSSGNTGAALAAYAAAAGMQCFLAIVDGAPSGKISQMGIYGAQLFMIRDFGITETVTAGLMEALAKLAAQYHTRVEISAYKYAPLGMCGVQTIAYELAETLGAIDQVFVPAGGGGLMLATVKGFQRWKEQYPGFTMPAVCCVQPEGNNTIAGALIDPRQAIKALKKSSTAVSGLQVPNILDGNGIKESAGHVTLKGALVQDADVYQCQRELAQYEGIYCEPAGAVALAGLKEALRLKRVRRSDRVVCLVTGHGFKDPGSAQRIFSSASCHYFDRYHDSIAHIKNSIQ